MTGIDAQEIFKFFNNKFIVNFYGSTENSPRISHFKFTINQLKKFKDSKILPVGKALDGTKVKIKKSKKNMEKNYPIDIHQVILFNESLFRLQI